ncbi:DUF309 domain-containing protein [Thermoflavimicrobium daqui]|uniref:DUF309 domain-containing protein n=1 Tax=Thermoflavimicrobium daqui TaxID=2137476 RepID=UPI0030B82CB2
MYPDLYVKFLYYFNQKRDYYECHEVLEELWLEEGRDIFYQGLLQVAVGLYHFENHNLGGAIKMMRSALAKLEVYPDRWMGINLLQLKEEVQNYLERLLAIQDQPFPFTPLYITVIDSKLEELILRKQ